MPGKFLINTKQNLPLPVKGTKMLKNMKKTMILIGLVVFAAGAGAQTERKVEKEEVKQGGFKKENLFTGGSLELGLGNGTTSIGVTPYFGYSINRFLDVAVSLNYDYISQRQYVYDYSTATELYLGKVRQNVIGPGAFIRLFPVRFLYAQAQYEQNFITYKSLPTAASGYTSYKQSYNVGSFLVGAGLASGRSESNKSYGYISVLFDVAKKPGSPYLDGYGNVNPVFRAGYNIALFQGKSRGGDRGYGGRFRKRRD